MPVGTFISVARMIERAGLGDDAERFDTRLAKTSPCIGGGTDFEVTPEALAPS